MQLAKSVHWYKEARVFLGHAQTNKVYSDQAASIRDFLTGVYFTFKRRIKASPGLNGLKGPMFICRYFREQRRNLAT